LHLDQLNETAVTRYGGIDGRVDQLLYFGRQLFAHVVPPPGTPSLHPIPGTVYCRRCRPACEISSEPSWLRCFLGCGDVPRRPRVAAMGPRRRCAVTKLGGSARGRGARVGPRAGRGGGTPVSRGGEAGRVLRRGRLAARAEPHRPRPLLP